MFGTFCIILLIVVIIVIMAKAGSKFPILGFLMVVLIAIFLIATCVQYEKDWGNEEEKEHQREQYTREYNEKLHREIEENERNWARTHPEEAKRQKEREEFHKQWVE